MPAPGDAMPLCLATFEDDPFLVAYGCNDGTVAVSDLRKPDYACAVLPAVTEGPG